MKLLSLGARDFRNLVEFRLEPSPRFNVIAGPNAQGKTNLLEAVYVLASLKSFRTNKHREMIRFSADRAIIKADVERAGRRPTVRVELGKRRRHVYMDGQPVRRLGDYLGTVQAVLFAPEDVALLRGAPSDRRTFLDRAIFNSRATYLDDVSDHERVLKQRNAVLRDDNPRLDLIDVYTGQLIEIGARIAAARIDYLHHFRPFFARAFGEIFDAELDVDLGMSVSWADEVDLDTRADLEAIRDSMRATFTSKRKSEMRRGYTLVGPQRDDFYIELAGRDASTHASQGQHRALVLALKTSEITMLRERFEIEPILLLDDVSSELDRARNAQLFDFLRGFEGQVFITTTSRDYIQVDTDEMSVWNVADGVLTEVSGH